MDDAPFIPACAYRRIAAPEPGGDPFFVCACSGGLPLGPADGYRGTLAALCGSCTVPAELDPGRRPCLYLVPVRIWEGDALRSGFSCRWFASLKPSFLPSKASICCQGCPHWFPRPPAEDVIPGMDRWIRAVIRMYLRREPVRSESPPCSAPHPADFSERVAARIRRVRAALAGR